MVRGFHACSEILEIYKMMPRNYRNYGNCVNYGISIFFTFSANCVISSRIDFKLGDV